MLKPAVLTHLEKVNFGNIPKLFKADATGAYFERCISCECQLLTGEVDYLIEKAIKSYEGLNQYATIFEYAMCWECVESMRETLSHESRTRMNDYLQEHADFQQRQTRLNNTTPQAETWLDHCLISNAPAGSLKEFQIYGHCHGTDLVYHHYPFMISGPVLDEMIHLISNQTLDNLQNFTEQLTDGPPEFADLLKSGPRVIL